MHVVHDKFDQSPIMQIHDSLRRLRRETLTHILNRRYILPTISRPHKQLTPKCTPGAASGCRIITAQVPHGRNANAQRQSHARSRRRACITHAQRPDTRPGFFMLARSRFYVCTPFLCWLGLAATFRPRSEMPYPRRFQPLSPRRRRKQADAEKCVHSRPHTHARSRKNVPH